MIILSKGFCRKLGKCILFLFSYLYGVAHLILQSDLELECKSIKSNSTQKDKSTAVLGHFAVISLICCYSFHC